MPFDPDKYLASKSAFDPDKYLASKQDFEGGIAPTERADWEAPPAWSDVAKAGVVEGLAAIPDVVLTAPQNLLNLGKMVYGKQMADIGYPQLAPTVTAPEPPVRRALEAMGMIPSTAGATPTQRIAESGIAGLTGGAVTGGAAIPRALTGAAMGGLSGTAGQATQELTGSPELATAAALAAPAATSRMAGSRAQRLAELEQQQGVRAEALRKGREAGLKVSPSEVRPSLLEKVAGKTDLSRIVSAKNQEQVNAIARRSVGLSPSAPLTEKEMMRVREQAYNEGYKPLEAKGSIQTDEQYVQDLDNILSEFSGEAGSFPEAVTDEVKNLVNRYRPQALGTPGQFSIKDALKRIQGLRNAASAANRAGDMDMFHANKALANALETQMERRIGNWELLDQEGNVLMRDPEAERLIQNFRDARKKMAISHALENAIVTDTGGVDARKLARDLNNDRYFSGELRDLAGFASAFPRSVAPPESISMGTPGMSAHLPTALSGVLGTMLGGPVGGIAGLGLPYAARGLAQKYLTSEMGQRGLQPDYSRGVSEVFGQYGMSPAELLAALKAAQQ